DAKRWNAELEQAWIDARRALRVDGRRPTGEDERDGIPAPDLFGGDIVADELRVHAALANATRDQLRVLAAAVEHEYRPRLGIGLGSRERNHLGHVRAFDSWGRPS